MGYFSNGTEGDIYRAEYCDHCANDGDKQGSHGCAIWDLHLMFVGDKQKASLLDYLIPRIENGLRNGECKMFRPIYE